MAGEGEDSVVASRCVDLPNTLSIGRVVAREFLAGEVSTSPVEDSATTCTRTIVTMTHHFPITNKQVQGTANVV